jgi:hypothetical protein
MTSRAAIIGVLTATCILTLATARGEETSSRREDLDSVSDPGLDPTVLHSRIQLTNEFKLEDFDASKDTATLHLAYAFGNPARHDWTVQLDLPVVFYNAGNKAGPRDSSGSGDIEFRVAHVMKTEGAFRWALGVEAEFDTAGGPPLGDGLFRLSPLVAFAYEPTRRVTFQLAAQFNHSLITETRIPKEQEIEVSPAINIDLPAGWHLYSECEETWELPAHGDFTVTLKFEVGRSFGVRNEWVVSARYEVPLNASSEKHLFALGCAYVFK